MKSRDSKAEEILAVAERMARRAGYNGFSYREIAKEVGIKAASVHYHFPSKAALGAAIGRRYGERFLAELGAPDDPGVMPEALLRRYIAAFRRSLVEERLMCLCGLLGAEVADLPAPVAAEAKAFFERNIAWLSQVFERASESRTPEEARVAAMHVIATLEGALILARTLDDTAAFDAVTQGL